MSPRRPGSKGGRGSKASRGREPTVRVKTAKGRKASSTRWLRRQLNDPYVAAARSEGMRSRAAYKLAELDDRFHFLKSGARILDLGAAPGGWSQIAVARSGAGRRYAKGRVVAVDRAPMDPLPGAIVLELDFLDEAAPQLIRQALGGPAEVILSDMAPTLSGHPATDHLRLMALLEAALDFALDNLAPGGALVAKVFQGGTEADLLKRMKQHFATLRHAKPPASRPQSAEIYVIAQGFKGGFKGEMDGEGG